MSNQEKETATASPQYKDKQATPPGKQMSPAVSKDNYNQRDNGVKITSADLRAQINARLRYIEGISRRISKRAHEPLPEALTILAELLREALKFSETDSPKSLRFLCRVATGLQIAKSDVEERLRYDLERSAAR